MPRLVHRFAALAALAALLAGLTATPAAAQSSGEAWEIVQPAQSSLVVARDGSLIGEIGAQWRTSVSLRSLPRYVAQAFIAVEDQRFYQHDGVDVIGIAGALKDALGGHARGASTITQQLVGNMHPDLVNRAERTIGRKLREQSAAREMEKHYTKEQILEAYLNQIDLGHGCYGVEAAARHYFGKTAARLTLAEAATLAALPKGPALFNPVDHPDRARARRDVVLTLMAEQHYITAAQAAAAKRQLLAVAPSFGMPGYAPYVVDLVRRDAERAGVPVAHGGYTVVTTIEPRFERAATEALRDGAARVEARDGYDHPTLAHHDKGTTDYLQGMVVALDPHTGDILALVGGRNFAESPFDRAVNAYRQPGSAFKPIVYAAALARGIPPNAILADTALAIPMDRNTVYRPDNADGEFLGPLTLREALVRSRNPVAVQLGLEVGMDSVAALAHRLGITTPIEPYPSSAIGASVVRPLEFVAAYTAFDDTGAVVTPRVIDHVIDHAGHTVFAAAPATLTPAMDPRVAWIVRDMMRDVVERGTAQSVRSIVPASIPVAGKTGTTNDNSDVWFVGMTPDVVAGVWLGFDTPKPIAPGAAGGSIAAPIWAHMIASYEQGRDSTSWDAPPAGIVSLAIDRATGVPADSTVPPERRSTEYFLAGTEPGAPRPDPWAFWPWWEIGVP